MLETVKEDLRKVIYSRLTEQGWPEEKIEKLIGVAGQYALSSYRFADRLLKARGVEQSRELVTAVLVESETLREASRRLRNFIDHQFKPHELLFYVRGMLVTLDGDPATRPKFLQEALVAQQDTTYKKRPLAMPRYL